MIIKKIKIGIKDLKTALNEFAAKADAIERGETVKKETGVISQALRRSGRY